MSEPSEGAQRPGKRELVCRLLARTQATSLLERLPRQRVLIILNYHRIGDASLSAYDPGLFSATADEFDAQIRHLKRRFHLATLEESLAIIDGAETSVATVLITFDDGYLDNYLTAFPILKSHGVQGVFFLATSFVGTGAVPWWDTIAYIVRYCKKPVIRLRYPADVEIDLKGLGFQSALRLVLREYKKPSVKDEERFLTGLEEECGVSRPASETMRCFLDWDEAREMQASGMAFGSHTHTHRILARLTNAEQRDECRRSREILEAQLGRQVDTLAYPVGGRDAFSADSIESLKSAGYRAAFSYYGGVNRPGETRRFDVRRFAVDSQSMDRLRLQTALAAVSGSRWF